MNKRSMISRATYHKCPGAFSHVSGYRDCNCSCGEVGHTGTGCSRSRIKKASDNYVKAEAAKWNIWDSASESD